jgi:phage replication-related protein YjqB (UPF0714/DUF867 family)
LVPEPARAATWSQLLAHPEVVERAVHRSRIGIMAFHGGLEGGTLEIAVAAADACGASLYTVEQPADLRWHVPSNLVDPGLAPALAGWLDHVEIAIALHGYGRMARRRQILLGGTNRELAGVLGDHFCAYLDGFTMVSDLALIPTELRGLHPANPVNRPPAGGVQVELPPSARGTSPGSDSNPRLVVEALVSAVRAWEAARGLLGRDGLNSQDGPEGRDRRDGRDGLAGVDSFDGRPPGHQADEHRSSRPGWRAANPASGR